MVLHDIFGLASSPWTWLNLHACVLYTHTHTRARWERHSDAVKTPPPTQYSFASWLEAKTLDDLLCLPKRRPWALNLPWHLVLAHWCLFRNLWISPHGLLAQLDKRQASWSDPSTKLKVGHLSYLCSECSFFYSVVLFNSRCSIHRLNQSLNTSLLLMYSAKIMILTFAPQG